MPSPIASKGWNLTQTPTAVQFEYSSIYWPQGYKTTHSPKRQPALFSLLLWLHCHFPCKCVNCVSITTGHRIVHRPARYRLRNFKRYISGPRNRKELICLVLGIALDIVIEVHKIKQWHGVARQGKLDHFADLVIKCDVHQLR